LGQSLYEQDRYKEAAINYRKALLRRPNDASILNSLGIVNFIIGEVEKAVEYLRQALKIFEEIKSPYADLVRKKLNDLTSKK
jgi:tetratricopeptide (TPR) repeat protein